MISEFAKDVDAGLSSEKKYLSSKYFYDDKGSALFQQIMKLPEYYLTRAEMNIFQTKSLDILKRIGSSHLDIIELGAGDGLKTIEFLSQLLSTDTNLTYYPIDISEGAIIELNLKLKAKLPGLNSKPLIGDYFKKMHTIEASDATKLVLFLGANIGNYRRQVAIDLLKLIHNNIGTGDYLLIGIDLKKNPELIARAYNDAQGVTRAFNLNLLSRINSELGGNISLDKFDFYSGYNPKNGEIESYLLSLAKQEIVLSELKKSYSFEKDELIFTELSKKYDSQEIESLAAEAGFNCVAQFRDDNDYFADCLFEKI